MRSSQDNKDNIIYKRNKFSFYEAFDILFRYKYLIWILALKELKVRYRGSAMGFLWSLLNPLLLLLIYTFVFTFVFHASGRAYPVYLFVGLLPYTWFQSSVTEATMSVLSSSSFITKSTLPSEIVVVVRVIANFLNYILAVPVLFLFIFIFGSPLGMPVILFPILLIIEFFAITGVGYFVATLQVFYRDVQYIVLNLLQILFFGIPIMYYTAQLSPKAQHLIYLNPLAYMIKSYQDIFYFNLFPKWGYLILLIILALITYILGYLYFHSHRDEFPELI